jgi:enoyl-CoA hydratase/carnithine racemase
VGAVTLVSIERVDDIAIVRLERPEKRNAMSFALLRELLACGKQLARDRALRAVILAGAGESFSAGIDLSDLGDPRNRRFAFWELIRPGPSLFQRAFLVWQELPVPVIAALHGHCFGAGMQLALAADLRIATPDCQLSIMEARWGLVPDMGITRTLRGLVPADIAAELIYSARVIPGVAAHELGLVTHVAEDPLAAARTLAHEFATRSPDALLAAKRVLHAMLRTAPARALRTEKRWQLKLLLGRNFAIARRRSSDAPERPFEPRQYR